MTAEKINQFIDHFTPIWGEDGNEELNPMPEKVKLTVYCDGGNYDSRGFLENVTSDELGLEALIAQKWILQSDLETLVANA